MIYDYLCECGKRVDVIRRATDYDRPAFCSCGKEMVRQIGKVHVSTPGFEPHYNHAFGKVITSKGELRETIRRTNDEKGMDLVEIGNEKPFKRKPGRKDTWEAGRELYRLRGK